MEWTRNREALCRTQFHSLGRLRQRGAFVFPDKTTIGQVFFAIGPQGAFFFADPNMNSRVVSFFVADDVVGHVTLLIVKPLCWYLLLLGPIKIGFFRVYN